MPEERSFVNSKRNPPAENSLFNFIQRGELLLARWPERRVEFRREKMKGKERAPVFFQLLGDEGGELRKDFFKKLALKIRRDDRDVLDFR